MRFSYLMSCWFTVLRDYKTAKSLLVEQQDESLLPSAGSYVKVLSCLHLFLHLSETLHDSGDICYLFDLLFNSWWWDCFVLVTWFCIYKWRILRSEGFFFVLFFHVWNEVIHVAVTLLVRGSLWCGGATLVVSFNEDVNKFVSGLITHWYRFHTWFL